MLPTKNILKSKNLRQFKNGAWGLPMGRSRYSVSNWSIFVDLLDQIHLNKFIGSGQTVMRKVVAMTDCKDCKIAAHQHKTWVYGSTFC